MYYIKIFTLSGAGIKKMEREIGEWLMSLKSDDEIVFMTQTETEETLIITFLYR